MSYELFFVISLTVALQESNFKAFSGVLDDIAIINEFTRLISLTVASQSRNSSFFPLYDSIVAATRSEKN